MEKLRELDVGFIERLEDREFIKWMIEKLRNEELDLLLYSTNSSKNYKSQAKLHTQFLQNKILLKPIRTKLRTMKILPPFDFIFDNKEKFKSDDDVSKGDLLNIAEENNADDRQTALMLFLQNHYEGALELYEKYSEVKEEVLEELPKEVEKKQASETKADTLSPKKEKKLQQKIDTLMKEKEELISQVQQLKKELREKNTEHQKEMNLLSQELALEKSNVAKSEEEIVRLLKQLENERTTHKELKQKVKVEPKPLQKEKIKMAMVGNPRNKSILSNRYFDIDIYELEDVEKLCRGIERYDQVLFLSWAIDEVQYEEQIPEDIRKEIKRISNFKGLRELMEELSNE